ncbi:MAG TPA: MBL fold metallo-hydrolase [Gemmatimonadaceae bacterium]|nr:MBL fold metallo-hydrolase [Gemmatimonadaceae bacterium]
MPTIAIRRLSGIVLAAAAFGAIPASLAAQPRTAYPEKRGLKLTDFPRLVKLADNVYGYEEIRNPGMTTVSMIVIGKNGVLIADGQGSAAATQTMLDHVRTLTPLPVKWYVVGSDHGDHTGGNAVLPRDITYVVSRTSREQLLRDSAAAAAPARGGAGGRGGAPRTVIVPPVAMTGDEQTIDVGGETVRIMFIGRAHTGGDLVTYLPREKILFMSEVYLNRVFPAMRSAYPSEWVAAVDKALAMDVNRYIPGHGFIEEPAASREELVTYRKALVDVIAEVKRLHGLGLTADAAAKQANWGEYKDWMLADQQGPIAVRKVYEEIEGKLPAAATAPGATTPDVTGKWTMSVQSEAGSGTPTVTFRQAGDSLTGHYSSSALGEHDFTGSITDGRITFTVNAEVGGQQFAMYFSGTLDAPDAMSGSIDFGGYGSGTFTARRQKP